MLHFFIMTSIIINLKQKSVNAVNFIIFFVNLFQNLLNYKS